MQIKCDGIYDLNLFNTNIMHEKVSLYLDTNIWYWLTYEGANIESQKPKYAEFINKIYNHKNFELLYSHLSYGELAHIIEIDKYKKYKETHSNCHKVKEFRKVSGEREDVSNSVRASIVFMDKISASDEKFVEVLNYISGEEFVNTLKNTTLDGTDVLMANFISHNAIKNIVTDDGDFLSIEGINVFTYNERSIEEAKKQDKLLSIK